MGEAEAKILEAGKAFARLPAYMKLQAGAVISPLIDSVKALMDEVGELKREAAKNGD